jgi:hypothetical protein
MKKILCCNLFPLTPPFFHILTPLSAQLVRSQLWWYGTEWLSEEKESKWPDSTEQEKKDSFIQENIEAESRGALATIIAAIATLTDLSEWDFDRVSTWNRLLRRTAWIFMFSNRCRRRTRNLGLGLTESIKRNEDRKNVM